MAIRIGKATRDDSGKLAVHAGQAEPVAGSREAGSGGKLGFPGDLGCFPACE